MQYDSYMTRFRNLFDTLKMTVLNSYTKSGFFAKNWARGLNGLQALFTTNKIVSKQADELGKEHANMKFVKTLWNLAETGLPEKVVSWMKPSIKYVYLHFIAQEVCPLGFVLLRTCATLSLLSAPSDPVFNSFCL